MIQNESAPSYIVPLIQEALLQTCNTYLPYLIDNSNPRKATLYVKDLEDPTKEKAYNILINPLSDYGQIEFLIDASQPYKKYCNITFEIPENKTDSIKIVALGINSDKNPLQSERFATGFQESDLEAIWFILTEINESGTSIRTMNNSDNS